MNEITVRIKLPFKASSLRVRNDATLRDFREQVAAAMELDMSGYRVRSTAEYLYHMPQEYLLILLC